MKIRKCPKCGNDYPYFLTHCPDCGSILVEEPKKPWKSAKYLVAGLAICITVLIIIFVFFPTVRYFVLSGQNFSETVAVKSAAESQPIAQFSLDQPVGNNDLQMTVSSAREGQNIFGSSNKLFIVTVFMKNVRTSGNIRISNNDFTLIDSEGTGYLLFGNGSSALYDLSPSQSTSAELVFTIPQNATARKIRFAFPGTSGIAGLRYMVEFVV